MSAVSESMNRRMTLGLLASRYGFDLDPTFATEVTITSIADDIDSVRPGALFMPSMQVDEQQLRQGGGRWGAGPEGKFDQRVRKNMRAKRIVMTQVPALISLILPVKILMKT